MCRFLAAFVFAASAPAFAVGQDIAQMVETHVLPGYTALATSTDALKQAADADCSPDSQALQDAYSAAFDAWVKVSHLRFGPSEQDDRAFALAFWPDPRGKTPKALNGLIALQDPTVMDAVEFSNVSIAARGFYALEFLLFDPQLSEANAAYSCQLIQAIAGDINSNAAAILSDWSDRYAPLMIEVGNDTYRSDAEAVRQIFTALSAGLEFTAETRLGRPLGTFERPRPKRAEAWRSGRSSRHVALSLEATRDLARLMSGGDETLDKAFEKALKRAGSIDEPIFAGVSDPTKRFRIEALQQEINDIRQILSEDIGPRLGIAAGFNSMDGD